MHHVWSRILKYIEYIKSPQANICIYMEEAIFKLPYIAHKQHLLRTHFIHWLTHNDIPGMRFNA